MWLLQMSGFDVSLHNKTLQFMAPGVQAHNHSVHVGHTPTPDDTARNAILHRLKTTPIRAVAATLLALAFLAHAIVVACTATHVPWCGLAARGVLVVQTTVAYGAISGGFRTAVVFVAALYEADRDAQQASSAAYLAAAAVILDSAMSAPPGNGRTAVVSLTLLALATCALLRAVVAVSTTPSDAVLAVVLVGAHASLATERHWVRIWN